MKLFYLKEMGTGQVVRKEIQCAFNFVWKIMLSSTLLNIVLFLPNKSSTSSYCPNALLKLRFWPLFWNLLLLLLSPDCCRLKLVLLSRCPLKPRLPSRCPQKLWYPSRGPSSSGCSAWLCHQEGLWARTIGQRQLWNKFHHHTPQDWEPCGREVLLGSLPLPLDASFPNKVACFVSMYVSLDKSVRQEPILGPWKGL